MFACEAHRAMDLMRNGGNLACRFAGACLGYGHIEWGFVATPAACGRVRGGAGSCNLRRHCCELLLDGLEFSQWSAELITFAGILGRIIQRPLHTAGQLL